MEVFGVLPESSEERTSAPPSVAATNAVTGEKKSLWVIGCGVSRKIFFVAHGRSVAALKAIRVRRE